MAYSSDEPFKKSLVCDKFGNWNEPQDTSTSATEDRIRSTIPFISTKSTVFNTNYSKYYKESLLYIQELSHTCNKLIKP